MGSYIDREGKPSIFMLRENNLKHGLFLQSVAIDEYKINKMFDICYVDKSIYEVSAGKFTNIRIGRHVNST